MKSSITWASLICVALAACAPQSAPDAPAQTGALPAPTPADVPLRIGEDQNGQIIEVAVGRRFAVELVGVPTAGYVWGVAELPGFLAAAGEVSGNTIAEQNQPGYAGGNHWEVLMFDAVGAGTGDLVLEQRRPWEGGEEPASQTFRVTIVAR
ncbi:MAG: protease inhibitor I42 family protein [Hyphomonadaceae bacterium]